MTMTELTTPDYPGFLTEIKSRIRRAQYQALRAVNKELVSLYWDLGQSIHQKQEALGWGKAVVQTLANDLQLEFPSRNGFSAANLWYLFHPLRSQGFVSYLLDGQTGLGVPHISGK